MRDRRQYLRIPYKLPVQVKDRAHRIDLVTADISRHSAFIVTDSPRNERELLQLFFDMPDGGSIKVMGVVARRVLTHQATKRQQPGMGIDFFALSAGEKDVWDKFVLGVQHGESDSSASDKEPIHRKFPRHMSCFLVQMKDRDRLREFFAKDISAGGMFLKTPVPDQVSKKLSLVLVHPESKDEFYLDGKVVRTVADTDISSRGVGVEFDEMPTMKQAALIAFIETGANYFSEGDDEKNNPIAHIADAVRQADNTPLAMILLGQALLDDVETHAAIMAFKRALELDQTQKKAHRGLHKAYQMLGKEDQAQEHLKALRSLE